MWIISDKNLGSLPIFCKKFILKKNLKSCILKITSLGIFNIRINGKIIDDYFMPGWTNYNNYINLCEYELANYLKEENIIEITVGEGWYSGRLGYLKQGNIYGKEDALFCQLIFSYASGEREIIESDKSWKVAPSKIVKSSFFDGENIDERIEEPSYDQLVNAVEVEHNIRMDKYSYSPVKVIDNIVPTIIYRDENTIKLDFNQNFAGFIKFDVVGCSGTIISVHHAEVLNQDGSLYFDNLRSAISVDQITLSDKETTFDPKFTYHGFRYAEINIKGTASISNIVGVCLSQQTDYSGEFECSDEIINKIYNNAKWGQKSNFISIPTDCPQRDERIGWTGDAQVFCHTAMFNANCKDFFANYLKLIRDDTLEDGRVPMFVPFFIYYTDTTTGVPGWADAICVIPYYHYVHYQDKKIIEDNIDCAENHVKFYLKNSNDYLINTTNPFGDWLSVKETSDISVINQCYLGLCSKLLSKMYGILNNTNKQKEYEEVYCKARDAFRKAYYSDGKIQGDTQTIYAFALIIDFVTSEEIRDAFVQSIHRNGDKITTGFVGVKFILPALSKCNEVELAYKLIKQTEYPSWGYTILNGATTIWERWNGYTRENGFETPSMNSFNHYSLGSCVEWMYTNILGIKLHLDGTVEICPDFTTSITYAKGKYNSCKGDISIAWVNEGGKIRLNIYKDNNVKLLYNFKDKKILSIKENINEIEVILD